MKDLFNDKSEEPFSSNVFLFPDDNFSKCQWIFTKLCMCIDTVEISSGIANGQILSIFDRVICPQHICILVSVQYLE